MNLITSPKIDKGRIVSPISNYQPSEAWKKRFAELYKDMEVADELRTKAYTEFNNRSVLTYQDDCQKAFNNYIEPTEDTPEENWKANTIRPITRNKVISIAAHVTSQILEPAILAQNSKSREDKEAASVMKDLLDYALDQSEYARKFVYGIISALVNPAIIFEINFSEIKRKIKEITEKGWKEKEVIDEVFSGFSASIVPIEELYIGDIYEGNIQKQPFLFRQQIIDYSTAKIIYGNQKNFKFVSPGIKNTFDVTTQTFYETAQEDLGTRKVERVRCFNRLADLELDFVNGIPMYEDPDRPLQRQDKFYPFAKGGYELIDEGRFFYYKSLVDKIAPDQNIIDRLYNMVIDGTFLRLFPPSGNYGGEELTSSYLIPGTVVNFKDTNSKLTPILPQQDLVGGLNMLQKVEASASESSQDPLQSGQANKGSQTAFEIARLEENAKTVLGLFGKMIGFLVEDVGKLFIGSIVQYMTVAQVDELVSDGSELIYKSVLIPNSEKGKSHRIDFEMPDDQMPIEERFQMPGMTPEQQRVLQTSMKLKEEGDRENIKISKVNPEIYRELKFKIKAGANFMKPFSEAIIKALNLEAYDRMINNPLLNQQEVTKEFLLGTYVPNKEEKFIAKQPEQPIGQVGKVAPAQGAIQQVLAKRMQMAKV